MEIGNFTRNRKKEKPSKTKLMYEGRKIFQGRGGGGMQGIRKFIFLD